MDIEQLKQKALSLPLAPGVYIMRDKSNKVIYVGKAKKLKNRVSQYFQDTAAHSPKTKVMVSKIDHFDVIVASSEFEALVLECSLIKQHMPRYNILLKDDKGYPYIRVSVKEPYPTLTLSGKISNDGAAYYGPYGSRGVTNQLLEALRVTLKLPGCTRRFPRDLGKGRPCLNYQMGQCEGWCQGHKTQQEYVDTIEQAKQILLGNYKQLLIGIKEQMLLAAEELKFELAASLRDRMNAIEALGKKQLVTAGSLADTDVVGFAQTESKACFAVLHFTGGNLLDKEYQILSVQEDPQLAVSSLLKQYYLSRGYAPKVILLSMPMEDSRLFADLLEQEYGRKTKLWLPQRGDNVRLVELACKNALEEAQRVTSKQERLNGTLTLLGKMLSMEPPRRIESFDVSNISGTDIVAGMVVFEDGKPLKKDYKRFKIRDLQGQDDYGSMRQAVLRRFTHYLAGDKGFSALPDLLLIDGGVEHAQEADRVLKSLGLSVPVFGMVKDNRHRTRALMTPEGMQIAIDGQQAVFSLIGNIQEETHRFAITYHRELRSKRLRYSELDQIPGVGPARKEQLLRHFRSIKAIAQASCEELELVLPQNTAKAVFSYFHEKKRG